MLITIPTYGRIYAQRTLHNLPPQIRQKTWLVVQREEYENEWRPLMQEAMLNHQIVVLDEGVKTIAATRDWIVSWAIIMGHDKLLMLDDDLDFAIRREDDPTKFRVPTNDELERMFFTLEGLLGEYAHVGVSGREGANRNTNNFLYNTRMMRILGYVPQTLRYYGIKFNEGHGLMEDFRVTLELLTRGYSNCVVNSFVQNQPSSQAAGGCSEYRTAERQTNSAKDLAARFPEFVKVVEKPSKNWNNFGGTRHDVVVQWKRAYNSAGESESVEVLDGRAGEHQAGEGV